MPFRHFLRPTFVTNAKTAFVTTRGDDSVKLVSIEAQRGKIYIFRYILNPSLIENDDSKVMCKNNMVWVYFKNQGPGVKNFGI